MGGTVENKLKKNMPNSWMRQTQGQSTKKRKKVEKTENFFETIIDQQLNTIDSRLAELKKIYVSGHSRPTTADALIKYLFKNISEIIESRNVVIPLIKIYNYESFLKCIK